MANLVGIDIGSYSLKGVSVRQTRSGHALESIGTIYNPVGQFLPSEPARFRQLAQAIKQLVDTHKLKSRGVYVGMPESMAYTSVITMPYLSDAELASSIHWEAEQHIPVSLDEVNLEYEVLYRPKKGDVGEKMQVLLVAARHSIIERIVELFNLAGVEVVGLETTMLGLHRSLYPTLGETHGGSIVCHLGASTTDILIVEEGSLVLTYSIPSGGLALTRSIEKSLGLTPQQSEEYKRSYGLNSQHLEGKVKESLAPVMNLIVSEIRKAVHYYQIAQTRQPIRLMVLSGGGAYLPEITSYFAQAFSYEVVMADPLKGVTPDKDLTIPKDITSFSAALGFAMRQDE